MAMRLWQDLRDLIFPPRETELRMRRLTNSSLAALLDPVEISLECTTDNSQPLQVIALLPYKDPQVQACVLETKFFGNTHAAVLLGYTLATYLQNYFATHYSTEHKICIVPIPLSAKRRRERGYNQVERIVRCCLESMIPCGGISIEVDTSLVRTRNTPPQTNLSGAERRKNMAGAFCMREPVDSSALYIIVDDVVTTGSTLLSSTCALRGAGAIHVLPLAMAH